MNDLKHVRRRIQSRKHYGYETNQRGSFLYRMVYRLIIITMCIGIFLLAFMINQKTNWIELPAAIKNITLEDVKDWMPFEGWFSLKDETVAAYPSYTSIKEDEYVNGSNMAYNIMDGVVLHVQQKENGKGSITIRQDNGILVTYGALTTIDVKQDERILKGSILGSFESSLTINCMKDEQKVDFQTALQEL